MRPCNMNCAFYGEPNPECNEHGEVAVLRAQVAKAKERIAELESQGRALADIAMQTKAQWDGQIAMTVHRLGGMVEGAPTHAGNFLQRVDALREIERAARSLLSRDDFWPSRHTLPGEYDNLRAALCPHPRWVRWGTEEVCAECDERRDPATKEER